MSSETRTVPADEKPYPELVSFFSTLPLPARALDVGCGTGRNALQLARLGFDVTALDVDATVLAQLRQQSEREHLPLITFEEDMTTLPCLGPFDLILLDRVLHYLPNTQAVDTCLNKLTDLLSPAGVLCAIFPSLHDDELRSLRIHASDWVTRLDCPATYHVPGVSTFTFHAVAWQLAALQTPPQRRLHLIPIEKSA